MFDGVGLRDATGHFAGGLLLLLLPAVPVTSDLSMIPLAETFFKLMERLGCISRLLLPPHVKMFFCAS